jgi:hypothetical protein
MDLKAKYNSLCGIVSWNHKEEIPQLVELAALPGSINALTQKVNSSLATIKMSLPKN